MWRTGHSLIKSKMAEIGAPLAGEMSGHIFYADRYYGYDDALYAAVRLLGILARGDESLAAMRDRLPAVVNTPELRFPCAETRKFAVVDEVRGAARSAPAPTCRTSTACGSRRRTAGGCCAPPTPRTCWWRAPRPRTKPASSRLKALLAEQLRASGDRAAGFLERDPASNRGVSTTSQPVARRGADAAGERGARSTPRSAASAPAGDHGAVHGASCAARGRPSAPRAR